MSRRTDRETLIAQLTRELPQLSAYQVVELARKLSRAGATLQRLAEAQCNGDWPADNGERPTEECSVCGQWWTPHSMSRKRIAGVQPLAKGSIEWTCKDCQIQRRVAKLLAPLGLVPYFQGDPRGPVLRVFRAGVSEADKQSGRERGIYVS